MLHRAEIRRLFLICAYRMVEGKVGPPKGGRKVVGVGGGVSGGVDKRKAEEKGIAPIPSR